MSGDYEHVGVMASCRCHTQLSVHKDLLQPGKEEELKAAVVKQIGDEGDPGCSHHWTPESFAQDTQIYLCDQEIEVDERESADSLLKMVHLLAVEAKNSALKRQLLKLLSPT